MTKARRSSLRMPRALHPGAWWVWALGMGAAASRTTNPLLLALIISVVGFVVAARRGDAPWARGFKAYLIVGVVVIAIRVAFRIVLDGQYGAHILFTLPTLPLPDAAKGVNIGGPVSAEGILSAFYDGLRLATLLICVGAANVLADPKRLLKAAPAALHEAGVALTVSLTVAPQLVESAQRIRRARRLRGEAHRRFALVRTVFLPVLVDALDRSLLLAAAMDGRGYGRRVDHERRRSFATGACMLVGIAGVAVGTYGLLDGTAPRYLGLPLLLSGAAIGAAGVVLGGKRVPVTRYRPDPWTTAEWWVAGTGLAVVAIVFVASAVNGSQMDPSLSPLRWPNLPLVPVVGVLVGLLPAFLAPPVPHRIVTASEPALVGAA